MSQEFDLDSFLPYQLSVAASRVSRAFAERYRRDFGLSIPEWRVLAHLGQSGAVSVREIHTRVDLDKSRVSRAAARLEANGYVTKNPDPDDGRLIKLSLTARGQALVEKLVPVAMKYQAELEARLGAEADSLRRALARLEETT